MIRFEDPAMPSLTPPPIDPSSTVIGKVDSQGFALHEFVSSVVATASNPWVLALGVIALGAGVVAAVFTVTSVGVLTTSPRRLTLGIVTRLATAAALVGIGLALLVFGDLQPAPATGSSTSKFINWAEKRYGVKVSEKEATSLTSGVTTPVDMFGIRTEIHGAIDNDKFYLFGATGAELPLSAAVTGIVSGG